MPTRRLTNIANKGHFYITLTCNKFYYLFDRHERWDILASTITHYQNTKSLRIISYVFMLNHLHMIISSDNISGFIRDFKKYTSYKIKENLHKHEPGVIKMLTDNNGNFRLWKDGYHPVYLESNKFFEQKIEYIHNNPVKKGYVIKPAYWYWSSANPESPIRLSPLEW